MAEDAETKAEGGRKELASANASTLTAGEGIRQLKPGKNGQRGNGVVHMDEEDRAQKTREMATPSTKSEGRNYRALFCPKSSRKKVGELNSRSKCKKAR